MAVVQSFSSWVSERVAPLRLHGFIGSNAVSKVDGELSKLFSDAVKGRILRKVVPRDDSGQMCRLTARPRSRAQPRARRWLRSARAARRWGKTPRWGSPARTDSRSNSQIMAVGHPQRDPRQLRHRRQGRAAPSKTASPAPTRCIPARTPPASPPAHGRVGRPVGPAAWPRVRCSQRPVNRVERMRSSVGGRVVSSSRQVVLEPRAGRLEQAQVVHARFDLGHRHRRRPRRASTVTRAVGCP